ncbi:hypothetical protein B296_00002455 [Ensete ventricosum]|uniref:ATPase AAA-type core domain-containing protein n=1 Tax=Ensete ventricosum TaxID=4639 RepID=A0A427BC93_ENSVE|nr:hypothetical protein B296_00002455 [Ensete ventricosum]
MPILNLLSASSGDPHLSCRVSAGSRQCAAAALFPSAHPTSLHLRLRSKPFRLWRKTLRGARFRRPLVVFQKLDADRNGSAGDDDFITRVLKENPSQVEPKFLVGDRFVTLREKQRSGKDLNFGVIQLLGRLFGLSGTRKEGVEGGWRKEGEAADPVYLKDLLREFKGKLYVPEEVFRENLSEEEEFEKNVQELPLMSFEDFQKHLKADKIKLLTSKSTFDDSSEIYYKDFVVDLKEIPGDRNIQKTKWLSASQARVALEEYNGPQYEIEKHTMGSTGVKFSDVAGIDDAVEELQEVNQRELERRGEDEEGEKMEVEDEEAAVAMQWVEEEATSQQGRGKELVRYLKNPELFDKMGIKPPHGVLLEGPPGCGKVNRPAVVFVDEIDALATRRQGIFNESTNYLYNAATQERETTLNQLLIELDGFDTGKGVIFLGATNRMDLLDPAILRPGRFDRKVCYTYAIVSV